MTDRPAVAIAGTVLDELVARAIAGAPNEQCGLLIGQPGAVLRVHPARNTDASPRRYTVDPADHFAALRAARAAGLAVIGAWHSHPAGAPVPSATDLAEATPDFLYLIVGLAPAPDVRAWQLVDGNFAARHLVRT